MVKVVIFDVGGVLVDYNMADNIKLLGEELGTNTATVEQIFQKNIKYGLALGMDEAIFWSKNKKEFRVRHVDPKEQLLQRTFEKTMKPIDSMFEFVESLKEKGLEVAILSDTIAAHAEILTTIGVYRPFEHRILSHQVKARKPDAAIFMHALELLNVQPSEAIFVDDLEGNIAGARALGIQGVLAKNPAQVQRDVLRLIE